MSGQSSIPAAITYLHGLAQQTATAVDATTLTPVGWPDAIGPKMFTVGLDGLPELTSGDEAQATYELLTMAGADSLASEEYTVGCWIYCAAGGTDQMSVITDAFALWDAFWPLLKADLRLGGAVQMSMVRDFRLTGPKSVEEAGNGRYAAILFNVRCLFAYS